MNTHSPISTYTVFTQLNGMLHSDLEMINAAIKEADHKDNLELLDSLKRYKELQIERLPDPAVTGDPAGTPKSSSMHSSYSNHAHSLNGNDAVRLVSVMHEVEKSQFEFMQSFDREEGLPDDLEDRLQSMINSSLLIIEQLDRMKSTNQISAMNVE